MPNMLDDAPGHPLIEFSLTYCRAVILIERSEQLELPIRMAGAQQLRGFNKLPDPLVAQQAADEQEQDSLRRGHW